MTTLLIIMGIMLLIYAAFIAILYFAGRKEDARSWGGLIPDLIILIKRLLQEPKIPKRKKILVAALIAYLALPIDIVPDFLPVIGQLDDIILVAIVLRYVLKGSNQELIKKHWSGPEKSLKLLTSLTRKKPSTSQNSNYKN